jgi:hypothetical protein
MKIGFSNEKLVPATGGEQVIMCIGDMQGQRRRLVLMLFTSLCKRQCNTVTSGTCSFILQLTWYILAYVSPLYYILTHTRLYK